MANGEGEVDLPPPTNAGLSELGSRQRRLAEALRDKDPRLAAMYQGALQILLALENPDRLSLSAHGFRELMEKMPNYIGLEGTDRGQTMNAKLKDLQSAWESACSRSSSFENEEWRGQAIDPPLGELLATLSEFFDSMKRHALSINQSIKKLIRHLDPYASGPPRDLEAVRVQEWQRCYVFFQNVCHHRVEATPEEFRERVDAIEGLMHDYLVPRTFDVHSELDALIEEAERDANS